VDEQVVTPRSPTEIGSMLKNRGDIVLQGTAVRLSLAFSLKTPMKIDTRDTTISDLLKDFLVIPRFQRPYSWEKEQVEQFWSDALSENPGDYFIGSIVLYKNEDAFGIVDGQQRITTIMVALCAVRNAFDQNKLEQLATALQQRIERLDIDSRSRFVLMTETSFPYLQDKILSRDKPKIQDEPNAEEDKLQAAFSFLQGRIAEALAAPLPSGIRLGKESKAAYILKTIRDKLLGLNIIRVQLDNEDDAYLIFETLNTRGKDLQVSHLLKNLLARLLRPKNKNLDPVKLKWAKLLETFETSQAEVDVDDFLHHYWLSRAKYVPAKKLFVDMKKEITSAKEAETVLDDLTTDAQLYRAIVEPGFRKWKKEELELRRSLESLAIFRVRQPFPLVLSILRAYTDKQLSIRNAKALLTAIERFHFAFTAVASRSSSGGLSLMYAAWAKQLFLSQNESDMQRAIKEIIKGLTSRLPPKGEFDAGFRAIRYSDEMTKQKKLVQYILRKVSDYYSHGGVAADHEHMTIEHVASQNPADAGTVSRDAVGKLGNLLWCDRDLQDELKNKPYSKKRETLKNSSVAGRDDIIRHVVWGDTEIDARTSLLASIMYDKVWK
jgi:uncharacterized protein with ParB-like and HNH nuclease domain